MINEKEIIEINGCRFEVDLTKAKKITEFKIGDTIKVLKKSYSNYESMIGTIIGFDYFKKKPAVNIMYLAGSYSPEMKFLTYTSESEDVEICPLINSEEIIFSEINVIENFNKKIASKQLELDDLERQKSYFISSFGKYFKDIKKSD